MAIENRALVEFPGHIRDELVFAQVLIRRAGGGFELCHAGDADRAAAELREMGADELGELARFTAAGEFRPLKSAPNLRPGWRCRANNLEALDRALGWLYPGAVADWYAARHGAAPTGFREFTGRQTGIYRVAATLDDGEAAAVARACCDRRFCLKQRLWTSPGLAPDSAAEKSAIPCLEPCALLIETARQAGLLEQARRGEFGLGAEEVETARIALAAALGEAAPAVREGDLGSPANPRRMRLLLERLNELPPAGPRPETDD